MCFLHQYGSFCNSRDCNPDAGYCGLFPIIFWMWTIKRLRTLCVKPATLLWRHVTENYLRVGIRTLLLSKGGHHVHKASVVLDATLSAARLLFLLLLLVHLSDERQDMTSAALLLLMSVYSKLEDHCWKNFFALVFDLHFRSHQNTEHTRSTPVQCYTNLNIIYRKQSSAQEYPIPLVFKGKGTPVILFSELQISSEEKGHPPEYSYLTSILCCTDLKIDGRPVPNMTTPI